MPTTFAEERATLPLQGYEVQVIRDALSDYRREWINNVRDCREGRRPNMSLEGAEMILQDTERLMRLLSECAS
jgi:hypothetical protein